MYGFLLKGDFKNANSNGIEALKLNEENWKAWKVWFLFYRRLIDGIKIDPVDKAFKGKNAEEAVEEEEEGLPTLELDDEREQKAIEKKLEEEDEKNRRPKRELYFEYLNGMVKCFKKSIRLDGWKSLVLFGDIIKVIMENDIFYK